MTAIEMNADPHDPPQDTSDFERMSADDLRALMEGDNCLLYTSPSPRDRQKSRMPSSA